MTEYFVNAEFGILAARKPDGAIWFIPNDPSNADYVAYQEWLAEGNTPEPWPPAE